MDSIFRALLGGGPKKEEEPRRRTAAELDELRQRFDNEQAQQDLSASEVWGRIGYGILPEDFAKVEALPAKTPVVHHYHPDNVPPRYITPAFELAAKHIASRDFEPPPHALSAHSLNLLAQYIEKLSGAKWVERLSAERRWEWAQPLAVEDERLNWVMVLESVRNLGHRIFHNDAKEFELSFDSRGQGFLVGVITPISEDAARSLRARRQARYVPHPNDSAEPPF